MTHSLFVKMDGVFKDPGVGARGLFIMEGDTSANAWEEALDAGEDVVETDIV